ncbi:MAG: insulinase family protein [Candidatus Eisenbacteria bacterium]|nr:insulinase family protein [Candidatus Eisenbacteria bacterium]
MIRRLLICACLLAGFTVAAARPATAVLLADSTFVEGWRLANGLEVRVRHVPGASGMIVVAGYRSGLLDDPKDREGLAELLANLEFFAAAGDIPARTREEMASLRPLGWKAGTSSRVTSFTEVATPQQFPGVLRQVATRMRGVTVTPEALASSIAEVRRDLASRAFGQPEQGLYWRVRALAGGTSDEALLAQAGARGLSRLGADEVSALLRARFTPANGCLALVGDFTNLDLRSLVEREFGSIPGGEARPDAPEVRLAGGSRTSLWPGLARPLGALGIIAPALDDSLHPSFYLSGLILGLQLRRTAGAAPAPLTARFQISTYEEPELLRLYPDLPAGSTDPAALGTAFGALAEQVGREIVSRDAMDGVKRGWDWLLGGPLPQALRFQSEKAPGMLVPLATGMVTRALWRGDDFWDRYRHRFETTPLGPSVFLEWMEDPAHQVRLVLAPKR